MDFFAPTDAADASTFLRSVNQSDGSFSENFLMPISGFENNGLPVIPKGYDKAFDLYLTVNASGKGTQFDSLDVTLWIDPQGNDGAVGVNESCDPSFSGGTQDDIALATGTMVSAHLTMDSSGARHADFVEQLTPTLAGKTLSDGSLEEGTLLQEQLSPGPDTTTQSLPQVDGTTINLLVDGVAKIDAPSFDAVQYQNNVFSTVQPDGTFVSHRLDPVTGFTLNGDCVVPAGFGTSYGLYFDISTVTHEISTLYHGHFVRFQHARSPCMTLDFRTVQ